MRILRDTLARALTRPTDAHSRGRQIVRRIVLTRRVAVPPQDVFVFFVPQRMPYWYGPEMRASFETQGCGSEFRAGSTVRISATMAKQNLFPLGGGHRIRPRPFLRVAI